MIIESTGEIYVASFSHISSIPALILPVKELTALCHSHGVMVRLRIFVLLTSFALTLDLC